MLFIAVSHNKPFNGSHSNQPSSSIMSKNKTSVTPIDTDITPINTITPIETDKTNSFEDNFVETLPICEKCEHCRHLNLQSIESETLPRSSENNVITCLVDNCDEKEEISTSCCDDTFTNILLKNHVSSARLNLPKQNDVTLLQNDLTLLSVSNDFASQSSTSEGRLSLASAASPNKTNEKVCRICLDSDDQGDLIAPCKCSGSTKYAHEQCLLKWFFKSSSKSCEVCLGNVNVKPMGYKPVQQWRLPERGCDFIVYLFGLYFVIMVIFTGMITWIATQQCTSPVCITLYVVCAVALVYFFYCCGCVEYSRRYWRSLVSINRIWRIYGREDSHKNIKLTPKISKRHYITPIQTSETIRSKSEPFVININSETSRDNVVTSRDNAVPHLVIPFQESPSRGTENPICLLNEEQIPPTLL